MSNSVEGKVIIVTGAGGGIGAATAELLASRGAKVALAGRRRSPLEEVAAGIKTHGGTARVIEADVASGEQVKALVAETVSTFGRLDGAFNNAGVDGPLAPAADYPEAEFDQVIAINLKGVWQCMRYQIPEMLRCGGGSIVNNASALGDVGQFAMAGYCASKAGVLGLTRAAALDYGGQGVRVNAVSPGVVETPMMTGQMDAIAGLRDMLLARHPVGRLGKPIEVGEAVAWLLSDASSFVLGANIAVDGGYLAL